MAGQCPQRALYQRMGGEVEGGGDETLTDFKSCLIRATGWHLEMDIDLDVTAEGIKRVGAMRALPQQLGGEVERGGGRWDHD